MRKLFLFIFIFLTTSCSLISKSEQHERVQLKKPTIHLHLYSSFKSQPEKYISAFTSKGYKVEVRAGELPENEGKSFIIHSPSILNPNHYADVEDILSIIKESGVLEINQFQYFLGKHSYTPNNVGVYLL